MSIPSSIRMTTSCQWCFGFFG
uniref:Uncharacterized protein n=1 Tax=Arundo donax TaxID=35708 RepID=A0A0A8YTF8_ARUDO